MTATREQLRAARDDMRGVREVRRMPTVGFEMREVPSGTGGTLLVVEGYASTTCVDAADLANAYELEDAYGPWTESIIRGAFGKTIREGCDTAFLVNHGGVTMARTKAGSLDLEEDSTGLHYRGKLNPTRPDVQILRAAISDGALDESSFAFRVTRQTWNDDYTRRCIQEVNLDKGDVSPCNYGANSHTGDHPLAVRNRSGARRDVAADIPYIPDYSAHTKAALALARARRDPVLDAQRQLEAARTRGRR